MKVILSWIALLALLISFKPGSEPTDSTPAEERLEGYQQRLKLQQNSLLKNIEVRSIGPTVMSGRVVDIDANPDDPTRFFIAYASGGLWKTETNGISFSPLFDTQASMTIGDIAGCRKWTLSENQSVALCQLDIDKTRFYPYFSVSCRIRLTLRLT